MFAARFNRTWRQLLPGLAVLALPLPALAGPDPKPIPPGTPVTITVKPLEPAAPTVTLLLKDRHGHAAPQRSGCSHTGGGNIDVQQPTPDVILITMTGVAVATGHPKGSLASLAFELEQCFDVVFEKPEIKMAKLTMEARVIGLLRGGNKGGCASTSGGCVSVTCPGGPIATLCVPDHSVCACEDLSLNDRAGPVCGPVTCGPYTLHQAWNLSATHPKSLCGKAASAEFAPDPALDPLWISHKEPFHGAVKKDFGFQILIKVAEQTDPGQTNGNGKSEASAGGK